MRNEDMTSGRQELGYMRNGMQREVITTRSSLM
jgi:hypothetical protein